VIRLILSRLAAGSGFFFLASLSAACAGHPSDAVLGRRLVEHHAEFDSLVSMAQIDSHVTRIAQDFTWLDSSAAWPRPNDRLGFSQERWNDYRRRFRSLGLDLGITRTEDEPGVVFLDVSGVGMVTGGASKGYAYSLRPLTPIVASLDDPDTGGRKNGRLYKPLGGQWYIYYEWGG
jgi:hypothetical protein